MKDAASTLALELSQQIAAVRAQLAAAHKRIANGLYGQARVDAEHEVAALERVLRTMGVRP